MGINAESYTRAAYPPPLRPPHLSDEDVSHALDASPKPKPKRHKAVPQNRYCATCGNEATSLSTRGLCARCQKMPGALNRRVFNVHTGKRKGA